MACKLTAEAYALVQKTFVFQGTDPQMLQKALADDGCLEMKYLRGDVVYSPRDYFRALGIVLAGSLFVSKPIDEGHSLPISRLGPGEVFGAAAIFNDCESFATALTAESDCAVLYFSEALVRGMMKDDFQIAENYIRYQSGRIRFLSDKIDGLSAGSAENRLARYLLENESGSGAVAASMTELAGMLNIGRASLYRAIDALCAAGAVAKKGRKIEIIDPEKLKCYHKEEQV